LYWYLISQAFAHISLILQINKQVNQSWDTLALESCACLVTCTRTVMVERFRVPQQRNMRQGQFTHARIMHYDTWSPIQSCNILIMDAPLQYEMASNISSTSSGLPTSTCVCDVTMVTSNVSPYLYGMAMKISWYGNMKKTINYYHNGITQTISHTRFFSWDEIFPNAMIYNFS